MATMIKPSKWRPNMTPREVVNGGGRWGELLDTRLTDCDGPDSDEILCDVRVIGIVIGVVGGKGGVGRDQGVAGVGIGAGGSKPKTSERMCKVLCYSG